MVYEIIFKKRFRNKIEKIFVYIEREFGSLIAQRFAEQLDKKFKTLSKYPFIGQSSSKHLEIRSLIIGKSRNLL